MGAQGAPMQHSADDATLTDHVDEHRSDNWASYGAPYAVLMPTLLYPAIPLPHSHQHTAVYYFLLWSS